MLVLCTDSLRGYGMNRIFEFAKELGFDGIDLAVDFRQFDTLNAEYLKDLSEKTGIKIHAVTSPKRLSNKKITRLVKLTTEVGAKILVLQPPKFHQFKLISWIKKEVPKMREKEHISIAMENSPAGTFLGIIPEHGISNTADLKKFKHISLDTARIGENKKDLMRAYNVLKKQLVHVHFSNLHQGKKYSPPDQGIIPLESFLTKLSQDDFPGAISIKILPKFLKAGNDSKLKTELKRIKEYYEKYYKS